MPVPITKNIPSFMVRRTDDLLINPETKEINEFGEPYPLRDVEPKDVWTYLKVQHPIGRKTTWKVDRNQRVWIIRMEQTPEDVRRDMNERLAGIGLSAQRDYWMKRNTIAKRMLEGVREPSRHRFYGSSRGAVSVGDISELDSEMDRLREYEIFAQKWDIVHKMVATREDLDHVGALEEVLETTRNDILAGRFGDEDKAMKHLRKFLQRNERYIETIQQIAEDWKDRG